MSGNLSGRYRECFATERFVRTVAALLVFFCISIVLTFFADAYAGAHASNSVTDLILSNVPAMQVDGYFVYGAALFTFFVALVLLANPRRIPFTLFAVSLFYLIRAGFITLTHLAPSPSRIPVDFSTDFGNYLGRFFFANGDGLFFSAHAGMPFLLALIFWENRVLRYIFLAGSLFFAVIVLLGHFHYSIDVASAYFITFTIYMIARKLSVAKLLRPTGLLESSIQTR